MVPLTTEGSLGVTAIDTSVGFGAVTLSVVEPEIPDNSAVTVVVPFATALASPGLLEALNVATVVSPDVQVTEAVRF
jgi:hypothetical protein